MHCMFGTTTTQTSTYETALRNDITRLETEQELGLFYAKNQTVLKRELVKHFARAKQLEECLRNRNSQLAILEKAKYTKEESNRLRAFLKVIRGYKLPGIGKIEGLSEQVYALCRHSMQVLTRL